MATTSFPTAQLPLSNVDNTFKSVKESETSQELNKLVLNNTPIICRQSDMYINATSICKAAGKFIKDWKRRLETQSYLQAVSSEVNILPSELVKFDTGSGSNRVQSTWVHPYVAIDIAYWADTSFRVKMTKWTVELLVTGCVTLGQEKTQQELEEATKKLFEQAKEIEEKDKLITKYRDVIPYFKTIEVGKWFKDSVILYNQIKQNGNRKHWNRSVAFIKYYKCV